MALKTLIITRWYQHWIQENLPRLFQHLFHSIHWRRQQLACTRIGPRNHTSLVEIWIDQSCSFLCRQNEDDNGLLEQEIPWIWNWCKGIHLNIHEKSWYIKKYLSGISWNIIPGWTRRRCPLSTKKTTVSPSFISIRTLHHWSFSVLRT